MAHNGLIVALGNPGRKYVRTRHNFGFLAADRLIASAAEDPAASCRELSSLKYGLLWEWSPHHDAGSWLLLKPQTFMNLSGEAVRPLLRKYGFESREILVLHDELDLEFGRMRFKSGGGLAGHKGLKSIAEVLGTRDFHRLRLGIGRPNPGTTVTEYVLRPFEPRETQLLPEVLEAARKGVALFCLKGGPHAVQFVNSFDLGDSKSKAE